MSVATAWPMGKPRDWREILPIRFGTVLTRQFGPVKILSCQELIPDPHPYMPNHVGYRVTFLYGKGYRGYVRMFRRADFLDLPHDDGVVMFYADGC